MIIWLAIAMAELQKRRSIIRLAGDTCGPFDGSSTWPATIPQEQNFCADPLFHGVAFEQEYDRNRTAKKTKEDCLDALVAIDLPDVLRYYFEKRELRSPWDWKDCRTKFLERLGGINRPLPSTWRNYFSEPNSDLAFQQLWLDLDSNLRGLVELAKIRPRAQFTPPPRERPWLKEFSISTHPSSLANRLSLLIQLRLQHALEAKESGLVFDLLRVLFRLREAAAQEGLSHGVSTSGSILNIICWTIHEGLAAKLWTTLQLDELSTELVALPVPAETLTAMKTEALRWTWFANDHLRGANWLRLPMDMAHDPKLGTVIDGRELSELLRNEIIPFEQQGWLGYLKSCGASPADGQCEWMAFAHMLRLLTAVECRLAIFYAEHHEFPNELKQAMHEVPTDLDGQPIRYAREMDHVMVWSVGVDLIAGPPHFNAPSISRDAADWVIIYRP